MAHARPNLELLIARWWTSVFLLRYVRRRGPKRRIIVDELQLSNTTPCTLRSLSLPSPWCEDESTSYRKMGLSIVRTYVRALPGATALLASFLSGYSWTWSGEASSFTGAHVASALLCLSAPIAFVIVGRLLGCRPRILKPGAILLCLASIPLLIANGIYLFDIGTPENAQGDIGGFGLALLGWVALLVTSLTYTIRLPRARNVTFDQRSNAPFSAR
jgi:hypothetical protein